jgi:hypothetical protein
LEIQFLESLKLFCGIPCKFLADEFSGFYMVT